MGRFFLRLAVFCVASCLVQARPREQGGSAERAKRAGVGIPVKFDGEVIEEQLKREPDRLYDYKKIELGFTPDISFERDDVQIPEGYHIIAEVEGDKKHQHEAGEAPFTYPAGMGQVLMNGCYGRNYTKTDPCYKSKKSASVCKKMIDGAAFLGVGFDGSGDYSSEGRKMSLVQRNCANAATYDGFDVPDTMNVHGIYDMKAYMLVFDNKEQYQKHLVRESGDTLRGPFFRKEAKETFEMGTEESLHLSMATFSIDIERYEIFMDEVKPTDLSLSFLRDFLDLPVSYFSPGSQPKYHDFIERWGTSYVKSAKFGGQLQIEKLASLSQWQNKTEFTESMVKEFDLIMYVIKRNKIDRKVEEAATQQKVASTRVMARGGTHEIATILTDMYSPTFKPDFEQWLRSIPDYPEAFAFKLGSIVDLLNFRANDLLSEENVDWGCEGHNLLAEELADGSVRWYYLENSTRRYCPFADRNALDDALHRRRLSLQIAIDIHMSREGREMPFERITIPAVGDCSRKPCQVEWTNAFHFDPTTKGGQCVHFSAISAGKIFIAFAQSPKNRDQWYYVRIGLEEVAIYKGSTKMLWTSEMAALSLGDDAVYQFYFVCVYETTESTLIEYGNIPSTSSDGHVYLAWLDTVNPLQVRFYGFGNKKQAVHILHVNTIQHGLMEFECKGNTKEYMNFQRKTCVPKCHEYCEPFKGCLDPGDYPSSSNCNACRYARHNGACTRQCPAGHSATGENKNCVASFDIEATASQQQTVTITNILTFYTLCLWKKIPVRSSTLKASGILKFDWNDQVVVLATGGVGEKFTGLLRESQTQSGFVFDESYQADGQWHHFCLTRAEFYNTDYFQVFADGQQIQQGRVPRRRRFTRRMNLHVLPEVGHETIRISGLALWYNRFSPGQIAWLSRGCSNTPPQHSQLINVLTWSQVLTHVRNLPWYKIPSTCDVQEDSNNKK